MGKTVALTGNSACAYAMRQINPDVVAAYPITPQTVIVEDFATYVANGEVDTVYVTVESEHSAMSACIGAAAAGARVMTASSAQGLAFMWEMLYIASSMRLPIVMHNINRALSGPINIHCDHSDSMGARDSGWIQIFSENAQEAYDNTIQAVRIAEAAQVRLPVMIMLDGFIISHAIDRVDLLEEDVVKQFVHDFKPVYPLLDVQNPVTWGPFDGLHGYYFEHKRMQEEAMKRAKGVIIKVAEDFSKLVGRSYHFFETYRLEDAQFAVIVLGSTAGTTRVVVDRLRENGVPAGMIKLRVYRPFPAAELIDSIKHLKAVAVLDRSAPAGAFGGPVFNEVRSALYYLDQSPLVANYIYGLGGRDVGIFDIMKVYSDLHDFVEKGTVEKVINFLGVRE